jgi:hypothetical protein
LGKYVGKIIIIIVDWNQFKDRKIFLKVVAGQPNTASQFKYYIILLIAKKTNWVELFLPGLFGFTQLIRKVRFSSSVRRILSSHLRMKLLDSIAR